MRCYICNSVMTPEEIDFDQRYLGHRHGPYVPCRRCQNEISDVFEDHDEAEQLLLPFDEYDVEGDDADVDTEDEDFP